MKDNTWKHDELLRARLQQFITDKDLTHGTMAAKLKLTSTTRLTKYLNVHKADAPEKDMPAVESAVRNFFRHEDRAGMLAQSLFQTSVSGVVADVLKDARRSGDVCLIHGPAGIGKSCGGALFKSNHDDVLMFTATFWRQGPRDVEAMLFEALLDDPAALAKPWPGYIKKAVWMEELFRGAARMIIIDTAQRLHITAFKWLLDFHDVTGSPIGLIGNPEILDALRPHDQLFSRIGAVRAIKMGNDGGDIAGRMIEQYAPGGEKDLKDLAVDVLNRPGHGRTLRKQLTLASKIREGKPETPWVRAFEAAGLSLLKTAKN